MNERIRELAKQAGIKITPMIVDDIEYEYEDVEMDGSEDLKKFAELIVRECVRYFNEDYQRDFDTLWREDLTKGIKEHFGVEE